MSPNPVKKCVLCGVAVRPEHEKCAVCTSCVKCALCGNIKPGDINSTRCFDCKGCIKCARCNQIKPVGGYPYCRDCDGY